MSGVSKFIDLNIVDQELLELLKQIEHRAGDLLTPAKAIGEIVVISVRQNFIAGGRPDPWKPLSHNTVWNLINGDKGFTKKDKLRSWAQKKLQEKKTLIGAGMNGGLMGSIHYEASADKVLIGTPKVYGAIHQLGGTIPAGEIVPRNAQALFWPGAAHPVKKVNRPEIKIPARPYLMVHDEDWVEIKHVLATYILP